MTINKVKALSSILVLSSGLIACGGDSDDKCVINANANGSNTVVCDGGTQVDVPKDKVKSVTKLLQSGESLALEHGFSKVSASAQYIEHNTIFPASNFPSTHSPKVGDAISDFSSNGSLSNHDGFLLSNGNYAIVNSETFMIINPEGEEILAMTSPDTDGKNVCNLHGAPIADVGFAVAYSLCNDNPKELLIKRFNMAGVNIGFGDASTVKTITTDSDQSLRVSATSDGGFAVAFGSNTSVTNDDAEDKRNLLRFNSVGEQQGSNVTVASPGLDNNMGLAPLAEGALLWVYSYDVAGGMPSNKLIQASIYDSTGAIGKTHTIGTSYIGGTVKTARADNGHTLIAYEVGGPDAMAFAVFDGAGELIAGPTTITDNEPDYYSVGVFGDGDFLLAMGEGQSEAGLMWNINNQGQLIHSDSIKFGHGWEPNHRFSIFPVNDYQVNLVYEVYSNPGSYMQAVAKNYLPVKHVSETAVTVTNWAANPLEIVLTVWETEDAE